MQKHMTLKTYPKIKAVESYIGIYKKKNLSMHVESICINIQVLRTRIPTDLL